MNVNIKRLSPDAQTPAYAHATDAGFDLVAAADVIIEPGETACVPTGLAFEIPEGYEMQIRPRSGITLKTKLRVQLGTVDAGYRGEVGVIVDNIAQNELDVRYSDEDGYYTVPESVGYAMSIESDRDALLWWAIEPSEKAEKLFEFGYWRPKNTYIIRKGDRIAQAVIKSVEQAVFTEVEALGDSDRGAGGFGSSGVGSPHPEYFGEPMGKERI
ncbi:deoxyuridine 5'-triphosphate nucleotidohydrolase [Bacillus spizizenii]|uniref:dUTP diphosphatase n=1 Tax=Bacillus spizizenii TaxID=96241 RepID=UPI002DB9C60C|nr:deoxyuridine 5'-triphosphate nucleotidohydrolase [Bacillus spizizenii]MEC1584385.1 deoxyuridine 5'-triphosphate nucleotidohydrolase [Bacillus spizizenii]